MHVTGKIIKILRIATTHDIIPTYTTRIMPTTQKRLVQVTLDIMCYDDLDIENVDWRELLQLEGDEDIHVSTRDFSDLTW
jgi:hypothetical protein